MNLKDQILRDIIVRRGYVESALVSEAERKAAEQGVSVIRYLLDRQLLDKDLLGQAVAEEFKVPYADLNSNQPRKEQVLKIPEDVARKYYAVLFGEGEDAVVISTNDPHRSGIIEALAPIFIKPDGTSKKVGLAYSLTEDIDEAFLHYKKGLGERFSRIIDAERRIAPEMLSEILDDAITYRVSDIHFEPEEKWVFIRFRIDGVLQDVGRIPKEHYENVINRIKVMAHLRLDDHFSAQDGSLRYSHDGKTADARVSVAPTIEGEKIVIRLLSEYVRSFALQDLGLSKEHEKALMEAAKRPFGMVLVSGPTGSGKTTTLYSLIRVVNRPEVNITTIEDPVEYRISRVNQIQVNPQTNLTFAKGLRSIVRQDPDIILVGEIRDSETAEIAVNAALTGHLLFSTFHANDSATSIPRLLDMGVEPFLLASTLNLVIAQRLVRCICHSCKVSVPIDKANAKIVEAAGKYLDLNTNVYKGKGCSNCNDTGYKGRVGIFEFIPITPKMQELILKNPSTQEVWALARVEGGKTLFEDGMDKVKAGMTTLEELFRAAEPPRS